MLRNRYNRSPAIGPGDKPAALRAAGGVARHTLPDIFRAGQGRESEPRYPAVPASTAYSQPADGRTPDLADHAGCTSVNDTVISDVQTQLYSGDQATAMAMDLFAAGSMFWFRRSTLDRLLPQNIDTDLYALIKDGLEYFYPRHRRTFCRQIGIHRPHSGCRRDGDGAESVGVERETSAKNMKGPDRACDPAYSYGDPTDVSGRRDKTLFFCHDRAPIAPIPCAVAATFGSQLDR